MNFWQRILAALAIGGIIGFASEMLFYIAPPPALGGFDIPFTWLFYSATAWLCLGLSARLGVRGPVSLFLVGCVFGWVIEGVVVNTVYAALPWTVPFTAMSWHGLVSGVLVFGAGRTSVNWPVWKAVAYWAALGILFGLWGQFWVIERQDMPPDHLTFAYVLGLGLFVPIAHIVLDYLPKTYPYSPAENKSLVASATLLWAVQMVAGLNPSYLVLPLVVLPTLWILSQRRSARGVVLTRARAPAWRHFLFMLTPLFASVMATQGWKYSQSIESNWPMALLLTAIALGIYMVAALKALRTVL